jgi:hypothetical protein
VPRTLSLRFGWTANTPPVDVTYHFTTPVMTIAIVVLRGMSGAGIYGLIAIEGVAGV